MKNMKNYSVENENRPNAGGSGIESPAIKKAGKKTEGQQKESITIGDAQKWNKRYSFDDNGGGYLGL